VPSQGFPRAFTHDRETKLRICRNFIAYEELRVRQQFRLGFILAACASLVACGQGGSGNNQAGGPIIGVTIQNREAQFYQSMELGMKEAASKYGYHVEVNDANRDNAKQQSQVEDFISRKVAAIVITPYDSQAIGSAIVEANTAKIPVFTADIANTSKRGVVITHIASNNAQGGAQAAKLLCTALTGTTAGNHERSRSCTRLHHRIT
jgi:ABC-type sugar transport system substrate-binding protein